MDYEERTDEEVLGIAKAYAYETFKESLGGGDPPRHKQNNATKIVGYLLKINEAEADKGAPPLGVILQEMAEVKPRDAV